MSKKKEQEAETVASLEGLEGGSKVDRIREIVFGAQMREYNQRFDTIGRDVGRLQQELAQMNEQLVGQLRQISAQLQELDKRVNAKLQENAKQLGERITELDQQHNSQQRDLDSRLAQQLQEQEERLGARLQEVNQYATSQFDTLQHSLRQASEEIRSELRDNADQLADAKMDRTTLGQLLVELGSSLQTENNGGMFDQLLDELADELES